MNPSPGFRPFVQVFSPRVTCQVGRRAAGAKRPRLQLGSPGHWPPASLHAEADLGLSRRCSLASKQEAPNLGLRPRGRGKGLLYASDCPRDCPGTKRGLSLPPATSLHPAVVAAQPHLLGLSAGTLGVCQLPESRCVSRALSALRAGQQSHRSSFNPQTYHPEKRNSGP